MDFRIRKSIRWAAILLLAICLVFFLLLGRFRGQWEMSVNPIGEDALISVYCGSFSDRPQYEVTLQGIGLVHSMERCNRIAMRAPVRVITWDESMLPGRLVVELPDAVIEIQELSLSVFRSERDVQERTEILTLSPGQRGVVDLREESQAETTHR